MIQKLHALRSLIGRLSPRERTLVSVFVTLIAVMAVLRLVITPAVEVRARLERRAAAITADLGRMEQIAGEIQRLEKKLASETRKTGAVKNFSLFTFVEQAAARSVSREAVASMNPSRRPRSDGSEETIVELKLVAIPLAEIVALLREIERPSNPAYVKRMELKRRYEDHARFDAAITVGAVGSS